MDSILAVTRLFYGVHTNSYYYNLVCDLLNLTYACLSHTIRELTQCVHRLFPHQYRECKEFQRHKMTMISPSVLHKHGIHVNKVRKAWLALDVNHTMN